jgi:TolB-like protein
MKKALSAILLCAFTGTVLLQDLAFAGKRTQYTLAVLLFDSNGRLTDSETTMLTERLQTELQKTGVFELMDRRMIESALQRVSFSEVGCSDLDCAVQAGRNLGAQVVVNGSVRRSGSLYFLDVNMVHVGSGQAVNSVKEDFDGDFDRLKAYMATVARKLIGAPAANTQTVSRQEAAQPRSRDDYEEPIGINEGGGGGTNFLMIGLIAAGAVGAGVLISKAAGDKNNDNNNNNNNNGSVLPGPPGFPTP